MYGHVNAALAAINQRNLSAMTITILTHDGTTRLPRPWSQAISTDELIDLIEHFDREHARKLPLRPAVRIDLARVDTDDPVAVVETGSGRVTFYAFTER